MRITTLRNCVLLFCTLFALHTQAQVTIGSKYEPNKGALLDLKTETDGSSKLGLGMPRVKLSKLKPINATELAQSIGNTTGSYDMAGHIGLIVYNTNKQETADRLCPGLHAWDGTKWQPLSPYPAIDPTKTIIGKTVTSEDSRTPINDPAKYPMGDLGTFTDVRGSGITGETNTYGHARFYADSVVATGDVTYRGIKNPYVCDARLAVIENWIETGQFTYIDDGIWMTSNVYATQKVDGTAFTGATARLNPAYYSNGTGAIAIGAKGLTGASITYGENLAQSTATTTLSQLDYAKKFGLSYTWAQASESCPDGWRLPNDYEWDALALAHGGAATAGAKMRANNNYYNSRDRLDASSGLKWGSVDAAGITLSSFAALPSGYVAADGAFTGDFTTDAYWWSASASGSIRGVPYNNSALYAATSSDTYVSVRCVKN